MQRLEGGFSLTALLDGTTINGILRVEGLPLVQRYDKDTNKAPVPNFEAPELIEDDKPTLLLILRDVTTGSIMTPNAITWKYNGQEITFGADNLSTNENFVGYFKRIPEHTSTIDGKTVKVPALRVMKNLVVVGGYDNDRISVSGSVEITGQSIAFQEISKDVVIQESTGSSYDVIISDNKGSALLADGESLVATANLYKDGSKVQDLQGVTFEWYKMEGTGQTGFGTGQNKTVSTDHVNNILKLRCDVKIDNSLVASGFTQISDFSDPYYVDFNITGITGTTLRKNETAVITPVARKRSSGEELKSVQSWSFSINDNKGLPFKLTGKEATFTDAYASVSYADMVKAGMGISGSVSANL